MVAGQRRTAPCSLTADGPSELLMEERMSLRAGQSVAGSDPRPREQRTPFHVWALHQLVRLQRTRASELFSVELHLDPPIHPASDCQSERGPTMMSPLQFPVLPMELLLALLRIPER